VDEQREGESTSPTPAGAAPARPLVLVVVCAALFAAFGPAGALRDGAAVIAVLGAASGPLLALSPGPVELAKLAWLSIALSPPLVAALAFGARAALGDPRLELARSAALCVAAACALVGLRARVLLQRPGLAFASVHVFALLAAGFAAWVWSGAGPNFAKLEFADWGAPRFALELAAGRELVPDVPWQAGAELPAPPILAQARAALGRVLDVGPFALAASESAWAAFVALLALLHLAAKCLPRGFAVVASVFAAIGAPAGALRLVDSASDLVGARIAFLDQSSCVALALVGLFAHVSGSAHHNRPSAWRVVAAVCFAAAFLADVWIGGAFLAAALVSACASRAAVERVLVLVVAALPGALVSLGNLRGAPPRALDAAPLLATLPWFAAALVLVFVARRTGRANTHAVELAKFVAASALVAAVGAWWRGAAAHTIVGWLALPATLASVGALALLVRRSKFGVFASVAVAGVLALSAHGPYPTLTRGLELGRGTAPVVDAGVLQLAPRRDDPERVAQAWSGAPPPNVFDAGWRPPIDVESLEAADMADTWRLLATDERVRALRPVLLVDVARPGVRWAGGAVLTFDGRMHEAAYLAALDLFVDRPHAAWRGNGEEHVARTLVAHSFFGEEGPGRAARSHLEALGRPVLLVIGPAQRSAARAAANVDLERRLIEFGCAPVRTCGAVTLFVWPAALAEELR
jgi:hypothetical protein